MDKISAVDIKELYYVTKESEKMINAAVTASSLKTLLADKTNCKKVPNIHQDTWSIEEAESTQDSYKDQLTGLTYRKGAKTMGDVTFNFTIGRYDYELKAEFMGGTGNDTSWERKRESTDIEMSLIALTEDNQYCVLPRASISARETNTDGATGIAIVATMVLPDSDSVAPEYWFDKSAVDGAS